MGRVGGAGKRSGIGGVRDTSGNDDFKLTLIPTVRLQKTLDGDGVTKIFSINDEYESGYLDIFINGLKQQITTHYSENTPALGTFTMVRAPSNGADIDVIWAKKTAFGSGDGRGPQTPSFDPPGTKPGIGNRVLMAGRDSSNNIVLAKTEEFHATSPTWTAISTTGLPATASGALLVRLDPWSPSDTAVITSLGENGFGLYKNTAWRTGDWSQTLTLATAQATTGVTGSTGWEIGQIRYTIAQPDFIAVYGRLSGGSAPFQSIFHSHDGGIIWSSGTDLTGTSGNFAGDFVIGQHDAEIMHVWIPRPGATARHAHGLSIDHGHTIPDTLVHDSNATQDLYLPYEGNDDDLDCYEYGVSGFQFTPDGWATESAPAVNPGKATMQIDNTDSSHAVWGDDDDLDQTTDAFATSTNATVTRGPELREHIGQGSGGWICAGGPAGGGNNALQAFSTPDWATTTERTGDLGSLLASGQIEVLVPDWTT